MGLESITLTDLIDLGMSGILLVQVIVLFRRLNEVTDKLVGLRQDIQNGTFVAGAAKPSAQRDSQDATD